MIAERLKNLRKDKGISKRELVAILPINYSTYANYESGFREPNSDVLQMIARHFDVSTDFLLGVSDNKRRADAIAVLSDDEHMLIKKFRNLDRHGSELINLVLSKELLRVSPVNTNETIDVVGKDDDDMVSLHVYNQQTCAGLASYFDDKSGADYEIMRFISAPVSKAADFCMRITDDSMIPSINDSDIVFVKARAKIDPDSVGVFVYENVVYCKRLRVDYKNSSITLEPINRAHDPIYIRRPETMTTLGLVIGIAE